MCHLSFYLKFTDNAQTGMIRKTPILTLTNHDNEYISDLTSECDEKDEYDECVEFL